MDVLVLSVPWECCSSHAGWTETGYASTATGRSNRHVIDAHGDHPHTCKKHAGSPKDAHAGSPKDALLDALDKKICDDPGLSAKHHNIPSVRKANGKRGSCHEGRQPWWHSAQDH